MKVKTRLYLIAIASLLSVMIIAGGLYWMSMRMDSAIAQQRYAMDLVFQISELRTRLRYMSKSFDERERQEWLKSHARMSASLLKKPEMNGDQLVYVKSIYASDQGLNAIFEHIERRVKEQVEEKGNAAVSYLFDRLYLQLEAMQEDSLRLALSAEPRISEKMLQNHLLQSAGLVPLALLMSLVAGFLARQISRSIEHLKVGMTQVADGRMDAEIKVITEDEIGALASHFNLMLTQLRDAETARKRLQAEVVSRSDELKRSERHYRALFDNLASAVFVLQFDKARNFFLLQDLNRSAKHLGNWQKAMVENRALSDVITGHVGASLVELLERVEATGLGGAFPPIHYRDSTLDFWMEGFAYKLPEGELVLVFSDISARIEAEGRLRLWAKIFDSTSEGVIVTDAQSNIVEVNAAFTDITQYSREEVKGKNPSFLQSGRHDEAFYQAMWESIHTTGRWRGEVWDRKKNGETYPEWLNISAVTNDEGKLTHYVAVFSDISVIKQSQARLDFLAHHDPLTKLPNRLLLGAQLEQSLKHAGRANKHLAVVFVDLDRFKNINDSLGHPAGDYLLQQVAERFKECLRTEDTVARVSGDEFVLLLNDIDSRASAQIAMDKLLELFNDTFVLNEQDIRVTASMGVALYPQDGESATALMRNADTAMYSAKDDGRNSYRFYTEELSSNMLEQVLLENALRGALERNEFSLAYQPQVNLRTGEIIGMEVLLRWYYPQVGSVSPSLFIPMAEANGLIHEIGRWVLWAACTQGKKWLDEGKVFNRLSVNVAGSQILKAGFSDRVHAVLDQTGFPSNHLELEVTESYIMQDTKQAIQQLSAIRGLDVLLSIDDFGTGYSSLSYLKKLPVHKLKIDQSFVRDIPDDEEDVAIAEAILALGQALDKTVIAEGVETVEQASFLLSRGCMEAQGYLFGKPMNAEDMGDILEAGACFDAQRLRLAE